MNRYDAWLETKLTEGIDMDDAMDQYIELQEERLSNSEVVQKSYDLYTLVVDIFKQVENNNEQEIIVILKHEANEVSMQAIMVENAYTYTDCLPGIILIRHYMACLEQSVKKLRKTMLVDEKPIGEIEMKIAELQRIIPDWIESTKEIMKQFSESN